MSRAFLLGKLFAGSGVISMNKINNERLQMYLEAEKAVLMGQSYTIGDRTLTRANLATIRNTIDDLIAGGATIEGYEAAPAGSSRRVVFMD